MVISVHRDSRIKLLFLLPAVAWVLAFTLFPLLYGLRLSLYGAKAGRAGEPAEEFVGLGNYRRFVGECANGLQRDFAPRREAAGELGSSEAWDSLKVTLIFVACGVAAQMTLGMALAVLFSRPLPFRGAMRTLMTAPLFATPMAAGLLFITVFQEQDGLVNRLLHLKVPWLSDPHWALASVAIVDVWQWTPFCFLIFLAALQGVPEDCYEAARLETRSGWAVFRHITLPFLKPTIVLVLLLRITDAFKVFDIPYTLTSGGPGSATQVLTMYAYRHGMRFRNYGYAASVSFVLFLLVMGLIMVLFKRLREAYR
ncbi:MAG: sugar ABC transporter permease [Planctomycetes bacterium]|nr:sugar ABC transporter permease [Planctomycetota bacterium]